MKTQTTAVPMNPIAAIAVNKSRIKAYKTLSKDTCSTTYYLQKGQEFEIELFNPTQETILAKIHLNNKPLSQGGLVLRLGERVFIERYLDVPKKFLFDTYEVGNSAEVQKAIEKNGDFKVEFFKEQDKSYVNLRLTNNCTGTTFKTLGNITNCTYTTNTATIADGNSRFNVTSTGNIGLGTSNPTATLDIHGSATTNAYFNNTSSISTSSLHDGAATMDWMVPEMDRSVEPTKPRTRCAVDKKTVETGRVEKGSNSDQKIQQVQMDFQYYPFHTVEAKLLPVSQKISTSKDLNVRQYCTNCGHKASKGDKFCSSCGTKM